MSSLRRTLLAALVAVALTATMVLPVACSQESEQLQRSKFKAVVSTNDSCIRNSLSPDYDDYQDPEACDDTWIGQVCHVTSTSPEYCVQCYNPDGSTGSLTGCVPNP